MTRTLRWARNGVAALAVSAALAFGVTQSLAAPREADRGVDRRACDPVECDSLCRAAGGRYGICVGDLCACKFGWR